MDFLHASSYRTSPEQAATWIASGGGASVAFLPETASPRKVGETLVALANAHGGVLLLGVNTAGQVMGLAAQETGLGGGQGNRHAARYGWERAIRVSWRPPRTAPAAPVAACPETLPTWPPAARAASAG